jgi:LPXTG-site transpeptidase (sortase) family protein
VLLALAGLALGGLLLSLLVGGPRPEPAPEATSTPAVQPAAEPTATPGPISRAVGAPLRGEAATMPESITPGLPVRLRIAAIGVDAPIVSVGLTSDGFMESPAGPVDTGWYRLGARPGQWGSAVIAGHSGFKTGPAVFDNLTGMQAGDLIIVVDDAGQSIVFRVRQARQYNWDERVDEIFFRENGRYLNLITCTGPWDSAAGSSTKRHVVFADMLPGAAIRSGNHLVR